MDRTQRVGQATGGGISRRELLTRATAGGLILSAGGLLSACSSSPTTSSTAQPVAKPRQGGTLRFGVAGGGPADTMDPHVIVDAPDQVYAFALYDQVNLVDENMVLGNRLAQEFTPNHDATQWTLRVKDGVEFHNGKTLSADDIIFSFTRLFSPAEHATDAWIGQFVASMRKINQPVGWFDLATGDGGATSVVPVGFDPKQPVGTGPFKFVSFSPGQQAVFERNPNYWGGPAYLDKLVVTTINDDTARLNALLTHQVDMLSSILPSQVPQVKALRTRGSPPSRCALMRRHSTMCGCARPCACVSTARRCSRWPHPDTERSVPICTPHSIRTTTIRCAVPRTSIRRSRCSSRPDNPISASSS